MPTAVITAVTMNSPSIASRVGRGRRDRRTGDGRAFHGGSCHSHDSHTVHGVPGPTPVCAITRPRRDRD
jgi:hypothetical protein